jgi:hypothetical protein
MLREPGMPRSLVARREKEDSGTEYCLVREFHLSFVAKKRSFGGDDAWGKERRKEERKKEV